jgi:hypothetical protein
LASEPSRGAALVAALATVLALGAAVLATELFVTPAYRPTAIRLICALVLLLALARVRAIVAAAVERRAAWGADEVGEGWLDRRAEDPRLQRFRDEIRFSVRSHSYFEHLLWPRLAALARARGGLPAGPEKPAARRFGLGPSVAALGRVIAALETRR